MTSDSNIRFGKFKGLTIRQIYQGSEIIDGDLLKSFLVERLNFPNELQRGAESIKYLMTFEINNSLITLTPRIPELVQSNNNWEREIETYFRDENISEERKIGTISLDKFKDKYYTAKNEAAPIISGQPEYLEWCIKKVNGFFIEPDDLLILEGVDINLFTGIEVRRQTDFTYSYSAKIKKIKRKFTTQIAKQNSEKYELNKNSITRDRTNYRAPREKQPDYMEDYFYAMTDGMEGDYDKD